jgi:hypothetical protein
MKVTMPAAAKQAVSTGPEPKSASIPVQIRAIIEGNVHVYEEIEQFVPWQLLEKFE